MKTKAKNERRKAASNAYYEQRNKRRAELESIESGRLFGGGIMYDAMKRAIEQAEEAAQSLIDKQAALLSGVAVALRGPEPPQTRWSHHDLPERAERAVADAAHYRKRWADSVLMHTDAVTQRDDLRARVAAYCLQLRRRITAASVGFGDNQRARDDSALLIIVEGELRALLAEKEASKQRLPTIEEMSGLVDDMTEGKSLKEYMEMLSDESDE